MNQAEFPHLQSCGIPFIWKNDRALIGKIARVRRLSAQTRAQGADFFQEAIPALRRRLRAGGPAGEKSRHRRWEETLLDVQKNFKREPGAPELFRIQSLLTGKPSGFRHREMSLVQRDSKKIIWKFPSARLVPDLWQEFLLWRKRTQAASPWIRAVGSGLILRCIHPFPDGNGRLARMLEYMDLLRAREGVAQRVHPEFLVHLAFADYLYALRKSSETRKQNAFLHFMLDGYVSSGKMNL
jgi:hypothetical protein